MPANTDFINSSRVAVYPSSELRPVPGFLFDVPDGWELVEAPSALALLRTIDEYDDFWPNVVVTTNRVPVQLTLSDAANATFAKFKEQNPGVTVRVEKLGGVGGRPTYLRTLDVKSPEGRELSQIHALFFAPPPDDSGTADLFQVVGTCPTALIDQVGVQVLEVITSFRFT